MARHALQRKQSCLQQKKVSLPPSSSSLLSLSGSNVHLPVIPIVADVTDTASFLPLVTTLDAIIEAIGGTADIKTLGDLLLSATSEAVQTHRDPLAPKLTYIYTSGTWVHGDDRTAIVTDTTAPTRPAALVSWRPALEQRVVTNERLNGIVIRPSLVYGRSGSILASAFKPAHAEGKVSWPGTPGGRLALVHCDDLADVYVRAAERAAVARGQIFDASNDVNESTDAFLQRLVEVSGASAPYQYREPANCECWLC